MFSSIGNKMSKRKLQQTGEIVNNPHNNFATQKIHELINIYKLPTYKLVVHCQKEHGESLETIGNILGISKQALQQQYIRKLNPKGEINE